MKHTVVGLYISTQLAGHLAAAWETSRIDGESIEQGLIAVLMCNLSNTRRERRLHAVLEDLSGQIHQWYESQPAAIQTALIPGD